MDKQAEATRWQALMVQAQRGDKRAYQTLLSEVSKVMEAYLRDRFGRSPFVQDCVQETLLAVHNARHTYTPSRPIKPWLFTILKHKTIDMLRRERSNLYSLDDYIENEAEHSAGQEGFSQVDSWLISAKLISRLDPIDQKAIIYTKFNGMTVQETASQLNVSKAALKVRVHRALSKLKVLLEAETI